MTIKYKTTYIEQREQEEEQMPVEAREKLEQTSIA